MGRRARPSCDVARSTVHGLPPGMACHSSSICSAVETLFCCVVCVGAPVPEARARTMACPHALARLSEPHVAFMIPDNGLCCITAAQLVQLMNSHFHVVVSVRASTSDAYCCRLHARFHVAQGTGQTSRCYCEFVESTARRAIMLQAEF